MIAQTDSIDNIESLEGIDIGERVKRLRSFRGLTCAELAKMVGCTRPYLSAVENGRYPASTKILRKLQKALGVTIDYFTTPGEPRLEETTTSITRERVMAASNISAAGGAALASERAIPLVTLKESGEASPAFDEFPSGDTDIIDCPPDVNDANAFAIRINSSEMEPLIPRGALAVISPNLPQRENRPVLVRLTSGELLCRRYQARRNTVILVPCSPEENVRLIDAAEIDWIYPVVKIIVDLYNDPVS